MEWESSTRRLIVLGLGWALAAIGLVVIALGLFTGNSYIAIAGVVTAVLAALLAVVVPEPTAVPPQDRAESVITERSRRRMAA